MDNYQSYFNKFITAIDTYDDKLFKSLLKYYPVGKLYDNLIVNKIQNEISKINISKYKQKGKTFQNFIKIIFLPSDILISNKNIFDTETLQLFIKYNIQDFLIFHLTMFKEIDILGGTTKRRPSDCKSNKISQVMKEFKSNNLKTRWGQPVENPKQAIAIALSMADKYCKIKKK